MNEKERAEFEEAGRLLGISKYEEVLRLRKESDERDVWFEEVLAAKERHEAVIALLTKIEENTRNV